MTTIEKRNGEFYVGTWAPWSDHGTKSFGQPVQKSVKGPFDTAAAADEVFYRT